MAARRTGPLAGAGVLALVLPLTIWYNCAPLAVVVVGVFAHWVLSLWPPMPFSLGALPTLRAMGTSAPPMEPVLRMLLVAAEQRESSDNAEGASAVPRRAALGHAPGNAERGAAGSRRGVSS